MAEFDWNSLPVAQNTPEAQDFNWDDAPIVAEAPQPAVLDEAQPDISWADRAVAKNFANSAESMAKYLQQEYPGLEVKVIGGEVVARRPGDQNFQKLDPSSFEFSDITDLGDVVSSGVASQLGMKGGAVLGGLAGAPTGPGAVASSVGGAIAGAGAASAGHEALRQYIGQQLGIPQEVSGSDAAVAGALGAGGVGLLGTGAMKGLAAGGETQGLLRAAWNKGMPKVASTLSGASDEAIALYTNPTTREQVEGLITGGRTDFTDDLVGKVTGALNQQKQSIGGQLRSSIDGADQMVDLAGAKKQYIDEVARLQMAFEAAPTNQNKQALDAAKASYDQIFGIAMPVQGPLAEAGQAVTSEIPDAIKPSEAWRLQQQLKDYGDLRSIGGGVNPRYASQATSDERALADAGLESYRAVGRELDRVTAGKSPQLKQQYATLADIQDALSPLNGNTQSAYSAFKNLDGSGKVAFKENLEKLGAMTGQDFAGDANLLQAADYFGTRSWMPQSMKGTTSTSRTLTGGGIGASLGFLTGGYPGMMIGGAAGSVGSSPQAMRYGIRLTDPLRSGADALGRAYNPTTPYIRETLVKTPWMGMD